MRAPSAWWTGAHRGISATSMNLWNPSRSRRHASTCRPSCAIPRSTNGYMGPRKVVESSQWSVSKEFSMPEEAAPGVDDAGRGQVRHPITGVSTSTAAFIGIAASGPFTPTLITNFAEYQTAYGGLDGSGFLGSAVHGFFDNGGTRCYVVRVEAKADPIASLQSLESLDVSIVCSPDESSIAGMAAALVEHCERMRYRIAVLDAP